MALILSDRYLVDSTVALEDGYSESYHAGVWQKDLRQRPWYLKAKEAGKLVFSDPYVDMGTKKVNVSPCAPFFDKAGKIAGVVCTDVALDTLGEYAGNIKYRGEGLAVIVSGDGKVLATTGPADQMSDASRIDGFGPLLPEMFIVFAAPETPGFSHGEEARLPPLKISV